MKINGNAIRPGNVIEHKDRVWQAVKIQHTQPGKGGAYLQVELRDLRSGTKLNERFRSSETVERLRLEPQRVPLGQKTHHWPQRRIGLQAVDVNGSIRRVGERHLWARL